MTVFTRSTTPKTLTTHTEKHVNIMTTRDLCLAIRELYAYFGGPRMVSMTISENFFAGLRLYIHRDERKNLVIYRKVCRYCRVLKRALKNERENMAFLTHIELFKCIAQTHKQACRMFRVVRDANV